MQIFSKNVLFCFFLFNFVIGDPSLALGKSGKAKVLRIVAGLT